MKTGPQTRLNSKIQQNMEDALSAQLALLDIQLKNWSDEWRNTVRTAFSTMPSDMDSLKRNIWLRMQDISSQADLAGNQVRNQIDSLEAQSQKLSHLVATRSLTIFLSGAALATVRPIAIGRKNWLFAGADTGAETLARAMTIIETAKLNGLDPQAYLADILDRIHDHKINRLDDLLPWNWAQIGMPINQAA